MRAWILDACEGISNLIALNSHIRELRAEKDSEDLKVLYDFTLQERRRIQTLVEEAIDKSDGHYHCALKHALAYYMYANEMEDADKIFEGASKRASDLLNIVISLMTKEEITLCSRCLADKILSNNNEQ